MPIYKGRIQQFILIASGLLCLIVAAVVLQSFKGRFGQDTAQSGVLPVMEDTIDVRVPSESQYEKNVAVTQADESQEPWVVYVTGSVKKPGVYEVSVDARIYKALEAAGGFSEDADREAVNLAAPLGDGAHIRFPAKGEKAEPASQNTSHAIPVPRNEPQAHNARKIDLNRCTAKDLEEVPGIGPKTALVIIQHREKNGGFRRIEDLLLVNGIGPKRYDAIKEFVVIAY